MRLLNPPSMFFSSIPYKVVMHLLQGRVRVGLPPCAALMLTMIIAQKPARSNSSIMERHTKWLPIRPQNLPAVGRSCAWTDCFAQASAAQALCRLSLLGQRTGCKMRPLYPAHPPKQFRCNKGVGTIVFQLQPTALAFGIHYRNRQSQRLHGRIQRNLPSRESGLCHPLDIHSAPRLGSAVHRVTC